MLFIFNIDWLVITPLLIATPADCLRWPVIRHWVFAIDAMSLLIHYCCHADSHYAGFHYWLLLFTCPFLYGQLSLSFSPDFLRHCRWAKTMPLSPPLLLIFADITPLLMPLILSLSLLPDIVDIVIFRHILPYTHFIDAIFADADTLLFALMLRVISPLILFTSRLLISSSSLQSFFAITLFRHWLFLSMIRHFFQLHAAAFWLATMLPLLITLIDYADVIDAADTLRCCHAVFRHCCRQISLRRWCHIHMIASRFRRQSYAVALPLLPLFSLRWWCHAFHYYYAIHYYFHYCHYFHHYYHYALILMMLPPWCRWCFHISLILHYCCFSIPHFQPLFRHFSSDIEAITRWAPYY